MRVHLVGVCGTGMGALAMLFRAEGAEVTGSDAAFDPPIGPALEAAGVICQRGFDAERLVPPPDLVVVGNAIRRDNVEAAAARERGLTALSMSAALGERFLAGRRVLTVTGTHGKTTTSSMAAWLLHAADLEPGYFIGGLPKNFTSGAAVGTRKRKLSASGAAPAPFVVEGDEYDAVYWHKQPKFLDYVGAGSSDVVILTSVEHDHIDIYPDAASYEAAFVAMVRAIPESGLLVCDAGQPGVVRVAREARCRVSYYALEGDDTGDVTPSWLGAPVAIDSSGSGGGGGMQPFDLFGGGVSCGRFAMRAPGAHNVRNAVAAVAACAEGFGVSIAASRSALARFEGVRRRQDLLGEPGGVRVYDDFAHHPTAVAETLAALRSRHPQGALWAVFEPRSATACRNLHQAAYVDAFRAADHVVLAPLGRSNVPVEERLDAPRLAAEIAARAAAGQTARAATSVDDVLAQVLAGAQRGDTVALLSNGAFAGLHGRLLEALSARK